MQATPPPPKGRTKIATETKTLKVGDRAPDFTLRSHLDRDITLSALSGQRVVLAFFTFAFTKTWSSEAPALNALQGRFAGGKAQVVGISCDSVHALKDWAGHLGGLGYPLCSDYWPHGAVSRTYGVFNEEIGRPERSIIVVDAEGIIRYIDVHGLREVPDEEEIAQELDRIS